MHLGSAGIWEAHASGKRRHLGSAGIWEAQAVKSRILMKRLMKRLMKLSLLIEPSAII